MLDTSDRKGFFDERISFEFYQKGGDFCERRLPPDPADLRPRLGSDCPERHCVDLDSY